MEGATATHTIATNQYTHPKDCPDRKEAAADRRNRDTFIKTREQQLQVRALAEWFDAGPHLDPPLPPRQPTKPS